MLHYLYLELYAIVEQINTKPKQNYLIVCNGDGTKQSLKSSHL
jgi:hypothetical protein